MTAPEKGDRKQPEGDPLEGLGPVDFDGHTAFRELTADQKLQWLAEAAAFALEARRVRRGPG